MRNASLFCSGWLFAETDIAGALGECPPADARWQKVDIPHDWQIADPERFTESSAGWYKKNFNWHSSPDECTLIVFDGVYMDSAVFVNGKLACEWKYGYTGFEIYLDEFLHDGENTIMVRCRNEIPNSRWYSGAGIYRNVHLITVPQRHIKTDGVYISTVKTDSGFDVTVSTEVTQTGALIRHTLLAGNGTVAAVSEGGEEQSFFVQSPLLWSPETPDLYTLVTELLDECGSVQDCVKNNVGFRWTRFDCNEGFFLNGEHMKINGVCQHHDLGCLGAAVNREAIRRQISILKDMGCNAIRTSHNPAAPELLELCDEMGMLVDSECFDMWERPKNPYDYARFFNEWAQRDVASWVRRDRNHPCVIMWSIGNEIYDTHADAVRGGEITAMLKAEVEKHDYRRNAPVTFASNFMAWENSQKCAELLDLVGYNYGEFCYNEHHEKYPHWVIYGSETASLAQTRGVYHFPYEQSVLTDDDGQCSALGNCRTSWGALSTEHCITSERDAKFSLGQFIWSGFDYIGEPTPYHTKNSYLGHIDTAGFPKDSYYVLKAGWTDYRVRPMVHLYPYWDFNEGQLIDVRACTNAPKVELFLNGRSLGVTEVDREHGIDLGGTWKVPYEKGTIMAVAYDENGIEIARDMRSSFGDAAQTVLTPDKSALRADGRDLVFIEISASDIHGNPVENANHRVTVNVSGAGRLVGLDNGNSKDYESYKAVSRRLFAGKLLAVIAATDAAGEIDITVTSEGLPDAHLTLTAIPVEPVEGITALLHSHGGEVSGDIPVRKVELVCTGSREMNENRPELDVTCILHPENAVYDDLEWRVTNAGGITTNIASITADGRTAHIKALGDGDFYVRCGIKNGKDSIELYSQLEFSITGMGDATIDPYSMVSGALFSRSSGEIGTGIERGFSTSRDDDCWACFDNIDFGDYGSDEITLPLFCLDNDPLPIEIWEGTPEDGELVASVIYHKQSIWNTYQSETYKLPRRLRGITSLSLRLGRKTHVAGFRFTRLCKAFTKLSALENDSVSGDSFNIGEDAVTNIGNNVSIAFDGMDFGEDGTATLRICGRTPLEKNTIQIRFTGSSGEKVFLVEFPHSDEYTEQNFEIEPLAGSGRITFVFLPGCSFDFKSFEFVKKNENK